MARPPSRPKLPARNPAEKARVLRVAAKRLQARRKPRIERQAARLEAAREESHQRAMERRAKAKGALAKRIDWLKRFPSALAVEQLSVAMQNPDVDETLRVKAANVLLRVVATNPNL